MLQCIILVKLKWFVGSLNPFSTSVKWYGNAATKARGNINDVKKWKNGSLDFKVFKIILEAQNGLFWPDSRNNHSG